MKLSSLSDRDSGVSESGGWVLPMSLLQDPLLFMNRGGGNIIDLYYYSLFFNLIGTETKPLFLFACLVYRPIILEAQQLKLEYLLVLSQSKQKVTLPIILEINSADILEMTHMFIFITSHMNEMSSQIIYLTIIDINEFCTFSL